MDKVKAQLDEINQAIKQLKRDTALIEECVQTSTDDPNWANVCVAPEEDETDRSDKDTAADIIWAASMYTQAGETCSPQVSFSGLVSGEEGQNVLSLQQLSNCLRTLDAYYATGGSTLVSNTYTTGISSCQMTAPVNGYYNVCVHAR